MEGISRFMYALFAAVGLLLCVSCTREEPVAVRLNPTEPAKTVPEASGNAPLRIGMGAMITPKEGYIYYQQLAAYLEKRLGRPVSLVDRENYAEMNKLMENGGVDAAFVCAGPYVDGKKKFGMELLAMPLVKGKPSYHSYIIVHRDSTIRKFSELRGKAFAFTDPNSNSGKLVPTYMLARMNETAESFFGRTTYTNGHDLSIRAVADRIVDGAAVDSLIWEYAARTTPDLTNRTRIILISDPYGIPPVVVRPGLDPQIKNRLQQILVAAADDSEGRDILRGMMIDRFIPGDDRNYDSIRTIEAWIAHRKAVAK